MEIKTLKKRTAIAENRKTHAAYARLDKLLLALRAKELPDETIVEINDEIDRMNAVSDTGRNWQKASKKLQIYLIQRMEQKHHLVPKNHYRNKWLALGMVLFGLPMGLTLGSSLGNMAFLAIGLPIGMVIGMAIGTGMDKRAEEEGRQFEFDRE
ncbi:hypothetical protein [Cyclobacterium xiamenense]|jgi:hypothetical protein|uniref:hypothetical protein n=1 Tax=Cyclobacterium xiamenense TaxID=1297121 RepID=UPI0012B9508B|nr:hypothetical protein [Cyclobacterium xiamenense]